MKTISAHPNIFYDLEKKIEEALDKTENNVLFEYQSEQKKLVSCDGLKDEVRNKLREIQEGIQKDRTIKKSDLLFVNKCYTEINLIDFENYIYYRIIGSKPYFFIFQPILFVLFFLSFFYYKHSLWTPTYILYTSLMTIVAVIGSAISFMVISTFYNDFVPKVFRLKCMFKKLHKLI